MNDLDNTGKLERRSSLANHASILKGQTAVDAAKAIEEDISRRFGVFVEEYVIGIVQTAINEATADLKAQLAANKKVCSVLEDDCKACFAENSRLTDQLAERDAQLAAERMAADSLAAMVRQLCFYKNDPEGLKLKAINLICRLGRGNGFMRHELDLWQCMKENAKATAEYESNKKARKYDY